MAKIINPSTDSKATAVYYSVWRVALVGAVLGAILWGLTILSRNFLSLSSAGDIATILAAAIGVAAMIYLRMTQPFITAVAAGVALWGIAVWSDGLGWAEVVAWNVALYCLAYVLFSWVARYARAVPVLIAISAIVIMVRVAVSL
ncbi:MAG: hypothetical protein WCI79_01360 [Candidatus Saccharibacteria bacterium]